MSARKKRIKRLRDLMDRQERAARQAMAVSEIAVRAAQANKETSEQRTSEILRGNVPGRLREALHRASFTSMARQDHAIAELQTQLVVDLEAWQDQRQRAASIEKLHERVAKTERELVDRAAERELSDIISSRIAASGDQP